MQAQTLKGFRDFLPKQAKKRQYVIEALKKVFELYGFEPLETPSLEYEEILLGKYGDEGDKLMYRFEDLGKRKVAMRYDQTVPLARVVSQYQNDLTFPFKRYQIQPVWRAENTQKGRFREFLQCDADIVGSSSPLADAEVITVAAKGIQELGFSKFTIFINDRKNFSYFQSAFTLSNDEVSAIIRSIDKLKKIGRDGVIEELAQRMGNEQAREIVDSFSNIKPTEETITLLNVLVENGISQENIQFYPPLARGLEYYTSTIFEIEIDGYSAGSVCGGGRYDNLIGMFANKQIPAVGFAFGFDRLVEAVEQNNLFPQTLRVTKVLVTIFSPKHKVQAIEISSFLRSNNISTDVYLDENAPLDKQLKYANQKDIPFVVIFGPEEQKKQIVTIRNMQTRQQKQLPREKLLREIS